ncbi:glycosyltransferase family 4 protein [Thalassospira sp. TSL5-1]|uniref:glycosyltransferase family 4 protein n=1 Tax=Thalassospira sp. TSL5-1 TaxID=1544451 RepID=UPI000940391A|nr:glycosyltransferase family 4 protein [Thalassospira sp. TSL5-1]OKH87448.1 hypothetical protein LF95_11625 [Thalassospira sp. TSL5-1]
MKIMMIIKGLHQAPGGAERVFCEFATYLQNSHTVTAVTSDAIGEAPFYPFPSNIENIRMGIGNPHTPSTLGTLLHRIKKIREIIIKKKPDVVLAFMHSSFIPVSLALMGSQIPVIACEHTSIEHYKNHPIEKALYWTALPFLRHITVPMESIRLGYPSAIRRKMTTIENPVNMPPSSSTPLLQRNKRIISIGRFDESKGHQILLEAFASIANQIPQWDLRILGDGPLRANLIQRVKELKLEERVSMPGIVQKVEPELQKAQIFALASQYESFGLVVAEAMASGLPCVAFANCTGVNNLIKNNQTGILAGGNMKYTLMADSLKNLVADNEARRLMGISAQVNIAQRFNIETLGPRLEKLIIQTIHNSETRRF